MIKKLLIWGSLAAILIVSAALYYVFVYSVNHHRDVNDEKAINIAVVDLVTAYQKSELAANTLYLNKAVAVKGAIVTIDKDQTGKTTLIMGSASELTNVFVTLKAGTFTNKIGDTVVAKGICSGFLSDVVLSDAVIATKD